MNSFKDFYEENKETLLEAKKKRRTSNKDSLKNACWDGYEAVGFKLKDGKQVPDCVPIKKNESFSDYYGTKEDLQLDEEMLKEDAATVVMAVLAFPSIVALLAWVGSILFTSYFRGLGKITGRVVSMWRSLFSDMKDYITRDNVQKAVKDLAQDPKSKDQVRKTDKNKRAFESELRKVYEAIESKDFELAKEEFNKAPKYIQNNPDVHKVIISEISRVLKEPPIYVSSPGNETYRAIKKVINIRVAKAAAYATKIAMGKNLKDSTPQELDSDDRVEQDTDDLDNSEEEDLGV